MREIFLGCTFMLNKMKSSQRFELPIYVFVVGIANVMLIIIKLQNKLK